MHFDGVTSRLTRYCMAFIYNRLDSFRASGLLNLLGLTINIGAARGAVGEGAPLGEKRKNWGGGLI